MVHPETWGEWHTALRKKWLNWRYARFPDTAPMTAEEMRDFLSRIERQFAPEVDRVVMKYADTGRWPPGSYEHAYFLARRVEFAFWILAIISTRVYVDQLEFEPVDPPTAPHGIIVKWLLKDAWEFYGRAQWIERFLLAKSK